MKPDTGADLPQVVNDKKPASTTKSKSSPRGKYDQQAELSSLRTSHRPWADVGTSNPLSKTIEALPGGQAKRHRQADPEIRKLPLEYEKSDVKDLVQIIGSMLMDLIRINDPIPLQDGGLTRFHSRALPGISVMDYLQRLTTHATLSPPILLSMVYYIDKLCALYPAFTISSLTVHRFLIASATVASKGLSDAFWTNSTYARVGGVSLRELALLELELLSRLDWRIVPQPEVLVEYYRSLVERSHGFQFANQGEDLQELKTGIP